MLRKAKIEKIMKKLMRFFQKKHDLMYLEDGLGISLCSMSVAAGAISRLQQRDEYDYEYLTEGSPIARFKSYTGKYFFGYLIEFVCEYMHSLGCYDWKEIHIVVLKVMNGFTDMGGEIEFMKLCLLEYPRLSSLDSERKDIKIFKDGIRAGGHDASLIIIHGFPDKNRIAPLGLDDSEWEKVHFPLLREYLLTGITENSFLNK